MFDIKNNWYEYLNGKRLLSTKVSDSGNLLCGMRLNYIQGLKVTIVTKSEKQPFSMQVHFDIQLIFVWVSLSSPLPASLFMEIHFNQRIIK